MTWELVSTLVRDVELHDPAVINVARTTRVMLVAEMEGCDEPAMASVVWEPETFEVFVDARAWRPRNLSCDTESYEAERLVSLRFPAEGEWTIKPGQPGRSPEGVVVEIMPAPERRCGELSFGCDMDCDCPDGEACLGANGFIGPFTECARACEMDRDCEGTGQCNSDWGGGVTHRCEASEPECDEARRCPDGFSCADGACTATFSLSPPLRGACDGDEDCSVPLRCVEPASEDGQRQCEVLCPTDSAGWCVDGHVCGQAADDASGQAVSDSVCVLAGE